MQLLQLWGRLGYTYLHVPVKRIAAFYSGWLNAIFLQLFAVIYKSFSDCFGGLGETLTPPLFLATVPPPSPPHHLSHHHHRRRRRRHRTSYPRIAYAARGGGRLPVDYTRSKIAFMDRGGGGGATKKYWITKATNGMGIDNDNKIHIPVLSFRFFYSANSAPTVEQSMARTKWSD